MKDSTAPDLTTQEGFYQFVQYSLLVARAQFESEGEVRPVTAVLITKGPDGASIPQGSPLIVGSNAFMPFTDEQKEAYTELIRTLIKRLNAVGTISISEAWMVSGDCPYDLSGDLEQIPGRLEIIMVVAEHKTLEQPQIWHALIKRKGVGVSLGEFEQIEGFTGHHGRFLDYLHSPTVAEA